MGEKLYEFSSRADLVCPLLSDSAQPVHFLSREYGSHMNKCFICGGEQTPDKKYHLHCVTCNLDVHKDCYLRPRCRLSELTNPHILRKVRGDFLSCFACKTPFHDPSSVQYHYHCPTCNVDFHKGCHLYLPEITHPFHPLHPLKMIFPLGYSYSDIDVKFTLPSKWYSETPDYKTQVDESDDVSISEVKCKCCQKHLKHSHDQHTLTLFPRRVPLPCDACGTSLNDTEDHVYTCHLCSYLVHRTCIYLPRVIKITRHPHRLSLSSSLPSGLISCGVCRQIVNVTCGQFSCIKGCQYAVHSRCAVKGIVWDGEDLEGVAEESDEDLESFVRIDDETIQHFSHDHHLRLHKNNDVCDDNRFCQACILPIMISESFYSCMQCDFLFHEVCASHPRRKDHPLHKHPLILHPIAPKDMMICASGWYSDDGLYLKGVFKCNGCDQKGYGFMYICSKSDCEFQLDIRCASLPDLVIHGSHPHDLFFNLNKGACMGCEFYNCSPFSLECIQCKLFLGLKCATLPSVMHYKHDRHPLTLCYGEEDTNGQYWCEVCETKLDAKEWFYKCDNYCNVTVHISCLLGEERFMKPLPFPRLDCGVSILRTSTSTREICRKCDRRSTEPFIYKNSELVQSTKFLFEPRKNSICRPLKNI
ncbi:hypothetical protein EUTSA_v10001211mg [Eutrema salsugineum]|uniref:Zinc finger PHD-type domain-containing protein n=1 Tax=Eutrema salsugineum TaxID=72664 RepID=V4LBJ3_EUTSA|nr:hypothetical protein EUTSA_v10001211mg [Eutrema salsugineum]